MTSRPVLHVAAMPFPTHQGTQGLIHHMLEASVDADREAHLLTYARAAHNQVPRYTHHRIADFPRVTSLRSGPSVGKLALDARLAFAVPRLCSRLAPSLVVAHHVEAALACLGRRPAIFFAHTDLALELPTYGPALASPMLAAAGSAADTTLARVFGVVATVSPLLAEHMRARVPDDVHVRWVPPPWPLPPAERPGERALARAELGLPSTARLLLYAGNLDAYQGWQSLVGALAAVRASGTQAALLVATASDAAPLRTLARASGVGDAVRVVPLEGEAVRRRVHAAADVAIVPRIAPGGLPIKLLDALARGVPTVVAPAASAGLRLGDAAVVAPAGDAAALAAAITDLLARGEPRERTAQRARAHVAAYHSPACFLRALDGLAVLATERARDRKFSTVAPIARTEDQVGDP